MAKVTVKTQLPLTNGKVADLTCEDGEVTIKLPVSWQRPTVKLSDLKAAVAELDAAGETADRKLARTPDYMETLRSTLREAADGEVAIVVDLEPGLRGDALVVRDAVAADRVAPQKLLEFPRAAAILCGSEELADVVRQEAKAAGVTVIA